MPGSVAISGMVRSCFRRNLQPRLSRTFPLRRILACSQYELKVMAGKADTNIKYRIINYPEKGQGLESKLALHIGSQILDEFPVAYVVSSKQREVKCSYCLGPSSFSDQESEHQFVQSVLHRCSQCKFIYYCGVRCQKKDWHLHKQECKNITKVEPKKPPDICRLASRLLTVLVKREELSHNDVEPVILTFEKLKPKIAKAMTLNQQFASDKRKEMLITFAIVLQSFVDTRTIQSCNSGSFNNLLGLLYWLTCNCFNILDDDQNSVGIGIYEKACLINHSCAPNCVAVFDGSRMSVRTIQHLRSNEEITISYIESIISRGARQNELQEQYLFKCTCEKCIADSSLMSVLIGKCANADCNGSTLVDECIAKCTSCEYCDCSDSSYLNLKCSYEKLRRQLHKFNEDEDSHKLEHLHSVLIESSALIPNDSVEMIKCYETLFDGFIQSQDWRMALECGLSLLQGYKSYYPRAHPITGIHLFKLGKLELALENLRCGLDFLEQCRDMMILTHGKEHRIVNYLLELISKLREEIIHKESR